MEITYMGCLLLIFFCLDIHVAAQLLDNTTLWGMTNVIVNIVSLWATVGIVAYSLFRKGAYKSFVWWVVFHLVFILIQGFVLPQYYATITLSGISVPVENSLGTHGSSTAISLMQQLAVVGACIFRTDYWSDEEEEEVS